MTYPQSDMRTDWSMRQFVGKVIDYLISGGDRANAKMNMAERGVPEHVQRRVLDGQASPC